jgi:hypothetical protein
VERFVLDSIAFQPDVDSLGAQLHVDRGSPYFEELASCVSEARAVARPKAMYRVGYIESRDSDFVVVDGVRFTSRVLGVNLEKAHRVFVYLATCGTEIQDWARSLDDPLKQYWSNTIQERALRAASRAVNADISERYQPGNTSAMAPGSLGEWPLSEQRPLFTLLGDTVRAIGVELTPSLLMVPTKSVSGIRFPTEERFESCQLCPRIECPGRRAPYDSELYDRKYRREGDAAREC